MSAWVFLLRAVSGRFITGTGRLLSVDILVQRLFWVPPFAHVDIVVLIELRASVSYLRLNGLPI